MRILVTGATGYVGSRLIPSLVARGHDVVCLARTPARLDDAPWRDQVQVVEGDLLDRPSIDRAIDGCDVAYYLVHSMGRGEDFQRIEAECAQNFSAAAGDSALRRIIYLGGLGGDDDLSRHLSSRHRVGQILAEGPVPVVELRAAVVIGAGSLSFELLRYITEVLPVMTTPRWVRSKCQPIAVRDLIEILGRAGTDGPEESRIVEIGGPDVVSYQQMMRRYAREADLPARWIIPLPVLSPGLSSLWVGLVTPLPPGVARPLIESLRHDVVVRDGGVGGFADVERTPFANAVHDALVDLDRPPGSFDPELLESSRPADPRWAGGTQFVDKREVTSTADAGQLATEFNRIGGETGYHTAGWAWRLRGFVDQVMGGPGLRRGRRDPETVREGEELDFWRVEHVEPGERLLLRAEMKLPGRAWLEFRAEPDAAGSRLVQTAYFRPKGLLGRLYWAALWPAHKLIFGRMATKIASRAADA